jgi:hypothetical protein
MLLDLFKALSFFLGIVSLYWVAISAFFVPGSGWEERLSAALVRLALAAGACFFSGLLFSWRSGATSPSIRSLISTLPVQLFFWGAGTIAILFVSAWYIDSYPCSVAASRNCGW